MTYYTENFDLIIPINGLTLAKRLFKFAGLSEDNFDSYRLSSDGSEPATHLGCMGLPLTRTQAHILAKVFFGVSGRPEGYEDYVIPQNVREDVQTIRQGMANDPQACVVVSDRVKGAVLNDKNRTIKANLLSRIGRVAYDTPDELLADLGLQRITEAL